MFARISDIGRMFDAMGWLRGRFDNIFNEFDQKVGYGSDWSDVGNYPCTNLSDKGNSFELIAEVPGMSSEDLDVKIQGNYLEISEKGQVETPEGYRAHRTERGSATFTRSLTLPSEVDSSKVSATLKDGLLVLTLPKSEAAKTR